MDDATHEAVREALLDLEPGDALAAEHAAHLDGCETCRGFAAALASVDDGLAALPPIEAPPALVARAAEAVAKRPPEREPARGAVGLFGALLAGLVGGLGSLLGLLIAPFRGKSRGPWAIALPAVAAVLVVVVGGIGTMGLQSRDETATVGSSELEMPDRLSELVFEEGGEATGDDGEVANRRDSVINGLGQTDAPAARDHAQGGQLAQDQTVVDGLFWGAGGDDGVIADRREARGGRGEGRFTMDLPPPASGTTATAVAEADGRNVDEEVSSVFRRPGYTAEGEATARPAPRGEPAGNAPVNLALQRQQGQDDDGDQARGPTTRATTGAFTTVLLPRADEATEGLAFRAPTGYWQNTYLPGDPAIRALRRRLADEPASLRLAELASPGDPSFEAPRSGALALAVEADRAGVEGPSRVRVSVGLRGAAQRAGRRPTLRAQVLLDLRRPLDEAGRGRVRALLDALARRQAGGDAMGLIVAGPDGGARIELGAMRFGEMTVALRRAFGPTPSDATPVALRAALEDAIASLGQVSDDGPLGSSMVLLVTPGLTEAEARELAPVAHVGALAGVATTVVGLGPDAPLAPMERVALAGQGRRRVLAQASEAEGLAGSEIAAVSRVIARAVRLRVRLAEGVRLVDVLGSRSLDELEATRVREAEQAIDRALAARLGIASDRGDDEDGIQIVIPAFYADDTHRVLLDLVVPGPGAVADVQVRYKDLVRLGNATLSDRLVLSRGAPPPGPAQRAVAAAVLGHHVAQALRDAAAQLDAGRPDAARATLEAASARLEATTRALPQLASEPAVGRDRTLVRRYAEALAAQPADALARSLRYAAHRRVQGDPLDLGVERR